MSSPPTPPPSPRTAGGPAQRSPPNALYGLHQHGYILGRTLGTGAYAKVKKAIDLNHNGRRVAIKIVNKKKAPRDIITKFLPREVETLRMIVHDNIIGCYDVIDTDDALYLVMELADGGDVLDYINRRTRLTEPVARLLFHDLLSGVEYCHTKSVVHRDLKCENLLLSGKMVLKISDFGFARKLEDASRTLETYCGSYAYAAPEVILGRPYLGKPADIWSMGVILYAMVVGRLPFKDNDVKTLLSEVSHHISLPPFLTDDVKDLIVQMLTYNPRERATITQIKDHHWMANVAESIGVRSEIFSNSLPRITMRQKRPERTKKPADKSTPRPVAAITDDPEVGMSRATAEDTEKSQKQPEESAPHDQPTTTVAEDEEVRVVQAGERAGELTSSNKRG